MASPNIIHGAFLAIAMRWSDRLIGLVSTVILARLLTPADFGIIATAGIVIALADVLLEMGVWMVLMQTRDPTPEHYDTAWTIRFIQTSIITALVLIAAPYAGSYFDNQGLVQVIRILALTFVFEGLENIWIINLQKEQQYTRDFQFMFAKRFTGFIITISGALIYESYWALVVGNLAGRFTGVILSYTMDRRRPWFSLKKFQEIFGLSQWVWMRSIATYFQQRLHEFVVASRESTDIMGGYTLAGQIATMPTSELLAPLNRVLFPAFVKVKHDLTELKRVFLLAQGVQALVAIPAGVGMMLVAEEIVVLMLGEKWLFTVPLVEALALIGCFTAVISSGFYVLSTLGKFRVTALYAAIQVAVFAALAYIIFPNAGAEMVANIRVILAAFGIFSFSIFLTQQIPDLKLSEIISSVIRPALASAAMFAVVSNITPYFDQAGTLSLIVKILSGALSYMACITAVWFMSGRKPGAESYLLEKFASPLAQKMKIKS